MEPVQGTNASLAIAEIAIDNARTQNEIDVARSKLVLDTVRQSGRQMVEMLEGLGEIINTYV